MTDDINGDDSIDNKELNPEDRSYKRGELVLTKKTTNSIELVDALAKSPKQAKNISKSASQIIISENPKAIAAYKEAEIRKLGVYFGGTFSVLNIVGGISLALFGASLAPMLLCFTLGAVCAGGTLAIASGQKLTTKDYSEMFKTISNSIRSGKKGDDENEG